MIVKTLYMGVEIVTDQDFQHHGILGQKWGVRNGPPYPLDQKYEINEMCGYKPITLYHGSKFNIKDTIKPHVSYDLKPLTYATDDYCYALLRSGNFSYDKLYLREDYDEKTNKISLAELHQGAFKELFDRPGYIYKLDKSNFAINPENKTEYITNKEVPYIEKIKIDNIWDEMQKYSNRYELVTYENPGNYWDNVRGGKEGYIERKKKFNNDLQNVIKNISK